MEMRLPLQGMSDLDRLQYELQQLPVSSQSRQLMCGVVSLGKSPIYIGSQQTMADCLAVSVDTVRRWTRKATEESGLLSYDSRARTWSIDAAKLFSVSGKDWSATPVPAKVTKRVKHVEQHVSMELPRESTQLPERVETLAAQWLQMQQGSRIVLAALLQVACIITQRVVGSAAGMLETCCRRSPAPADMLQPASELQVIAGSNGQLMWSFAVEPGSEAATSMQDACGLQQPLANEPAAPGSTAANRQQEPSKKAPYVSTNTIDQITKIQILQQSNNPDPSPSPNPNPNTGEEIKLPRWLEERHLVDVLEIDNLRLMLAETRHELHGVVLESDAGRLALQAWALQSREGSNPLGLFLSGLQGRRDRFGKLWSQRIKQKHEQRAHELIRLFDRESVSCE